jgi:nucleoid DNA-binding protein
LSLLEYIKDQLLFNDSVTLPGLGSFEIRRISSKISGKKIMPPGLGIVFNTENSLDDGSLAKSIAGGEEIPVEEAGQRVLELVDEILFALNKGEEFVFKDFGVLYRDEENVFRFEKDPAFRIDYESYGLEAFELDPDEEPSVRELSPEENIPSQVTAETVTIPVSPAVETTQEPEEKQEKPEIHTVPTVKKANRSLVWILTGAAVIILISFIIVSLATDLLDGKGTSLIEFRQDKTGVFPEDDHWDVDSKLNPELGEAIDSLTSQENALLPEQSKEPVRTPAVTPKNYAEYHIIAGSFKDREKAGIMQQSLTQMGYPALVIKQGDHLYRVSAMSFKDKEAGLRELDVFRKKTRNHAAWLLELKN